MQASCRLTKISRQNSILDRLRSQLGDIKDPQVGAPLSELKLRIVIAA
jgi:hypothetical protein